MIHKAEDTQAPWRAAGQGGIFTLNTRKKRWQALGIAAALLVTGICIHNVITGHFASDTAGKAKASVPVTVATADLESLPEEIKNIGNVEAFSTVNVIAQVGGQLMSVHFKQGDYVKQGDLLFEIDPRTYQAAVNQAAANVSKDQAAVEVAASNMAKDQAGEHQAQANLQRDMAAQQYAQVEARRYTNLVQQGAVSSEQSGQMNTNAATASATVQADKAAVQNALAVVGSDKAAIDQARASRAADRAVLDNARVQLSYTKIFSPIDGRTGALNVYPGNVVRANDTTPLVSINQTKPIYVSFSVPEEHLDQLRPAQAKGLITVAALIEGKQSEQVQGIISFLDNTVDKSTGAIRLRGTFTNEDQMLWPGQFVDVVLTLPADKPMVVVPTQAIQNSQQGQSVFVVKANNTASLVPVKVKRVFKDKSILSEGLSPGATVVTDGQLLLTDGASVTIKKLGP